MAPKYRYYRQQYYLGDLQRAVRSHHAKHRNHHHRRNYVCISRWRHYHFSCLIEALVNLHDELNFAFLNYGVFSELEYFHYISYLGISFWFVMLVSAGQAGKFISETLSLKNQNTSLLGLMDIEKQEVVRINNQLVTVNKQLDLYNHSLESQVEKRTEEIYRLSNVDPLTNLMNRSAFLFSLTELIRREVNGN